MKKLFSYILVLVTAFALVGCSQPHPKNINDFSYQRYYKDSNLVDVSYIIVEKLENNLKTPISPDDTIIVASFVDVNNLKASSTFGRIIAEQVGSRFAQKGYKIIEMKLRQKSVYIEEGKGEFLLSRNLKEIGLAHNASAVVVGTYGRSRDRIYTSTRIVNPSDSVVLSSCDHAMPAGPELQKSLF
ncbi:MAG: FlgO family outer membrane protein [Thermodesulfobacteriota bacterium]|nr:FlgO family outer membrane protein [Thermodesulfobacteriota bacterium]